MEVNGVIWDVTTGHIRPAGLYVNTQFLGLCGNDKGNRLRRSPAGDIGIL